MDESLSFIFSNVTPSIAKNGHSLLGIDSPGELLRTISLVEYIVCQRLEIGEMGAIDCQDLFQGFKMSKPLT
jgi:hypothetical protein